MEELTKKTKLENISSEQEKNIQEVFKLCPELEQMGTLEQYGKYLETIFPESKAKDVVWHGSLVDIVGGFNPNQHFGSFESAKSRAHFKKQVLADMSRSEYYYPAVINISNPKRVNDADYAWEKEINQAKGEGHDGLVYLNNNEGKNKDSYVVFDADQTHVLGSKTDIERFKEFVANENK